MVEIYFWSFCVYNKLFFRYLKIHTCIVPYNLPPKKKDIINTVLNTFLIFQFSSSYFLIRVQTVNSK